MMSNISKRALFMELIGVFTICFLGGWAVLMKINDPNKGDLSSIALSSMMIYSTFTWLGSNSGGHYNPAVTLS